jgi:hypothetical protein
MSEALVCKGEVVDVGGVVGGEAGCPAIIDTAGVRHRQVQKYEVN